MLYFMLLLTGGLATSFAEYFLNYNLVDLIKDKLLGLEKKLVMTAADFDKALTKTFQAGYDLAKKAL